MSQTSDEYEAANKACYQKDALTRHIATAMYRPWRVTIARAGREVGAREPSPWRSP